jgi:hypothetical protein
MTGGIRRLATAVKEYRGSQGIFLENGGLVDSQPPYGEVGVKQNLLKVEALTEALGAMKVDAINLGVEEASEGRGMLMEIGQLADGKAMTTSLAESPTNKFPRWIERGPFLIGGLTPAARILADAAAEVDVKSDAAAKDLLDDATRTGKTPILMLRGGLDEAKRMAGVFPDFALIVYKSDGTAPATPLSVGNTLLVTPGDNAKNLIAVDFAENHFSGYRVYTLTPSYTDEPRVSKLYRDYLRSVDRADLIAELGRVKSARFAGSQACLKCHEKAFTVWRHSAHAHALADLEVQGHAKDPDCLHCHVTALESLAGFYSRTKTPNLANVTCESCHGPGATHAQNPKTVPLPKVGAKSCLKCHGTENSPNFNFEKYWARISHR